MNRRHHKTQRVVLGLALLLLCACGDSASDRAASSEQTQTAEATTDAKALDACSLLSKDEAEAALSVSLQDPEPTPFNPITRASECEFAPADPNSGLDKAGSLLIRIEQPANPTVSFAGLREQMGEVDDVSGVGDEAFYAASQLFVLSDPYQLTVAVGLFGSRGAQRQGTAVTVAETILPRL